MNQYNEFLNILKTMEKESVEYVLVGGFAVILHGMPRHTVDIDFFVKNEKNNIKKLRNALQQLYNDPEIEEITTDELIEYPVIRYGTPNGLIIDIMTKQGETAVYNDLEFQIIQIEGQDIRVATPETLLRLKKNSVRPGDQKDAIFLKYFIDQKS